jgi:sporulation protein YqfD
MMGLFDSLAGKVVLAMTSADLPKALSDIRSVGIAVSDVRYVDDLCLQFSLRRRDWTKLQNYAARKGWGLELLERRGLFWTLRSLLHRPVLVVGLTLLLILSIFLPGRILFVQVEGNSAVATNLILEAAAKRGVCLGAAGRDLRSERIKNSLLEDIPQLQWLGVNTKGCVAVISVRERQIAESQSEVPAVTSLISQVDGIIQSLTVTQGTPMCKPGDGVTAGQTLISGLMDLGICLRGTQAKGEIFALTNRKITAVAPTRYDFRGSCQEKYDFFGLLIGKKRINLYKGSGILGTTCARIYSEWYMTLPGGFVLPIGLFRDTRMVYEQPASGSVQLDLAEATGQYLLSQMQQGQILASQTEIEIRDDTQILQGSYACREMVGVTRIEENWNDYGKNPGKDRQR